MATRPEYVLAPLLFFVLIGTWYLVTRFFAIPEFILPAPGKVWNSLVSGLATSPRNPAGYWYHLGVTAGEALLGFLIGCAGHLYKSPATVAVGIAIAFVATAAAYAVYLT